eukprot:31198-Pelagococcus_subviridis.AAC.71
MKESSQRVVPGVVSTGERLISRSSARDALPLARDRTRLRRSHELREDAFRAHTLSRTSSRRPPPSVHQLDSG